MEAGRANRRITIHRATATTDSLGGEVKTWAPLATVWAEVTPISDGERWRAGEVGAHVSTRFRILWGPEVEVTDRIDYDGRLFDIVGVKEVGNRDSWEITAAARAE